MFIKAKLVGSDGEPKGRSLTYESDIEVDIGDKVVADMGGSDKVFLIVSFAEPSDYENVDFEIKKIKSIYNVEVDNDGVIPQESIDISVESVMPVIKISNFEGLKDAISKKMEVYKNIVVTEQSLSGCKATQKELASLRIKVDSYRKDKKKELSAPIAAFEDQCKVLIQMIENVEQPIKDGIKVFDDQQKDVKRMIATRIIAETVNKYELSEKYAMRLDVSERYCNLTAKEIDVRSDVETRAFALKVEQDKEAEMLDIIQECINEENKAIKTQLQFSDFSRMIDRIPVKEIIAEVRSRAKIIYDAENRPIEPPKVEIVEPVNEVIQPEPIVHEVTQESFANVPVYFAEYRIVGTESELLAVSAYLKTSKIQYSVITQGEVK